MNDISDKDVKRAALYALRHYVPFSYYAKSPEILASRKGVAAVCFCSAFVMVVRGQWLLVTAGHVLDEMERERKRGIEHSTFRLWDGWAIGSPHKDRVAFDFDAVRKYRIYEDGLDYGWIVLSDYLIAHLRANDVVPIGEEQYAKVWPKDFPAYVMIGTPGTTVSLTRTGERSTEIKHSTIMLTLAPESNPPAELIQSVQRFYGRILAPEDSPEWQAIGKDITGMSGGPVIGVRREPEGPAYWVVGVQSGWLPSQRIIAASYFQAFALALGRIMDGETP